VSVPSSQASGYGVKLESLVVKAGTDRPSPSWGGGLFAGSSLVLDTNNDQ
jgi:hypothetical protein